MDEETLISEINKILKAGWSRKQAAHGKWIEVRWEWVGLIGKTVLRYKARGWDIKKQVEIGPKGRRIWLIFMNPNWHRNRKDQYPAEQETIVL